MTVFILIYCINYGGLVTEKFRCILRKIFRTKDLRLSVAVAGISGALDRVWPLSTVTTYIISYMRHYTSQQPSLEHKWYCPNLITTKSRKDYFNVASKVKYSKHTRRGKTVKIIIFILNLQIWNSLLQTIWLWNLQFYPDISFMYLTLFTLYKGG